MRNHYYQVLYKDEQGNECEGMAFHGFTLDTVELLVDLERMRDPQFEARIETRPYDDEPDEPRTIDVPGKGD